MKPRVFVASSAEQLDLSHAAQEELDHDLEPTVWTQGVFALSQTAVTSLLIQMDDSDFGLFILAPDDVTAIRDRSKQTVRDNVIFELGLSIGRLGMERCFIIVPRGLESLHLPTDILGLTPASYDSAREDGNVRAALGPACSKIRQAALKLGRRLPTQSPESLPSSAGSPTAICSDPDDCVTLIQSWMGSRERKDNLCAIRYDDVDRDLGLTGGSSRVYLETAAASLRYQVARKGKDVILFEEQPWEYRGTRRSSFLDDGWDGLR